MTLAEQFRTEGLNEAKRSIALSLLQTNIALDIIKQATGLSLEEIQNLKEK